MAKLKLQLAKPDLVLLATVIVLTIFGLVMIYNASVVQALRDFADKYYFLKLQIVWAAIGLAALMFFSQFDYHHLRSLSTLLIIVGIVLLVVILIPGVASEVYGAKRRIDLGPVTIQPAELIKISYVLYLASWLAKLTRNGGQSMLALFLTLTAVIVGLVLLEPDLGTAAVIVATGLVIYFAAGAPIKYFLLLGPGAVAAALIFALSAPYRINRLLAFINPLRDPQGSSYHINQILIALANGGLFGLGFGQSKQKYEYIPEVATDSIFAIIAEEIGFVGAMIIISLFLLFLFRGFKIARDAPDKFGEILALGITTWIGLQAVINLSAMVALLPLTGIPLPFISYGGSALITTMVAVGILLNISRQQVATTQK